MVQWTIFPPNARSRLIGLEQADKKMVQWTIFPPNARSRLIGLEQAGKKMVRWIFPPKCLIGPEQAGRLGRKKPPRGAACGD